MQRFYGLILSGNKFYMKLCSTLIAVLIFISYSCKKTGAPMIDNDEILGSWLLKSYAGGISYKVIIPIDTTVYRFEKPGKYKLDINSVTTAEGKYAITTAPDDYYYSPIVINLYEGNNIKNMYGITLRNDSLIFSDGCCDGYTYTYIKK